MSRFLITGHTGFKGSWLTVLLKELGHEVVGYSLKAETISLFEQADIKQLLTKNVYGDIRDKENLAKFISSCDVDYVIHFAAQPLVSVGYSDPLRTFTTNVNGTLNILETCKNVDKIKKIAIITTDKVYSNTNHKTAFKEDHPLGGKDPYSASKSMADILSQSYAETSEKKNIFIARGGNVIGGGDFSHNRIIPDLYRAYIAGKDLEIRNPQHIRPWQHVLECLSGYLSIFEIDSYHKQNLAWNIGPLEDDLKTVENLVNVARETLNVTVKYSGEKHLEESPYLVLDSNKLTTQTHWKQALNFEASVDLTAKWYSRYANGENAFALVTEQTRDYLTNLPYSLGYL